MAATTEEVPRPYGRGTSSVVSFVMALNRVNVVAVTTILVLHVGVIGHHVPCRYDFMFPSRSYHARLRARGGPWRLAPQAKAGGAFGPPRAAKRGLGGGAPPNVWSGKKVSVVKKIPDFAN